MNETTQSNAPSPSGMISPFKVALIVSALMIVLMAALSLWAWKILPADAKVPMHWNARGEVDGWAGPGSLFLVPGAMVFIAALFAVIPMIEPRKGHLLRSSKAYHAIWYGMLGFFLILHCAMVWVATGNWVDMNLVMGVAVGLLFILIGNYFGKIRSNWVMGIRTPWTLSSELSWNKTHRLGGRLFVGLGLLLILGGLFDPTGGAMWIAMVAGVFLLIGVTFTYSYFVWKNDPDKVKVGRS